MSHHWDLLAPLICYVANPWLDKKHRLMPEKIHPFREKEKAKPKPFDRENWQLLKARLKGRRDRKKR